MLALFEHENECVCSYTVCVVLAVIPLTIRTGIGAYFAYKCMNHWYLKKDVTRIKFGRGHSIITFALRGEGEGGFLKMRTKANGGRGGGSCLVERSQRKFFY